jgi:hypothetical protein
MHSRVLFALICCAVAAMAPPIAGAAAPAVVGTGKVGGNMLGVAVPGDDVRAKTGAGRLRLAQNQGDESRRGPPLPDDPRRGPPLPDDPRRGPPLPDDPRRVPPPPSAAPAFGTPNVVFVAGIWRIVRSSGEFYLWADNGDRAIQITVDSNGWWGVRRQSDEKVVWSSGSTGEGTFYERPWLRAAGPAFPISSVTHEVRGTQGTTFIRVSGDQIRITLTDRGEIQVDSKSRAIVFKTSRGGTVTF